MPIKSEKGKFNFQLSVVFALAIMCCFCQSTFASSAWGHTGQSVYLMAIEMPANQIMYETILGEELYSKLTNRVSPGRFEFDLENLNKVQLAFIEGAHSPDTYDVHYYLGFGWPIHRKYPQRMLNYINDLSNQEKGEDYFIARAFFFGWAFHYVADLVFHPNMYKGNDLRITRDYDIHAPQHVIFEGLIDRLSINYWFLKHREMGIYPSKVISMAGKGRLIKSCLQEIPNHWDQFKDDSKIGVQVMVNIFKGIFNPESKTVSEDIQDGINKVKYLNDALYDKSLKAFFKNGVPEEDIMEGKIPLSSFLSEDLENPIDRSNASQKESVVASDMAEGISWWKEIMRNAPDGFRHALRRDGFSCSLDYGPEVPTPEPELDARAKSSIQKIYNSVMGR
ncbi:MAG: zinc dependent phospholipase C family protein [Candidatus Riflebacteria bacterium]|nr:zinc dependent phospholipase C family protein [Candidatus Riflebacteria bacterium]